MKPVFHLLGDAALLVAWPHVAQANALALALKASLARQAPAGFLDYLPGQESLLIRFDPLATEPDNLQSEISKRLKTLLPADAIGARLLRIPVCYDPDLAPDLEPLARSKGMTAQELASLHAGSLYTALFLGFLPGFAYLSGLPDRLRADRHMTPRPSVPAGSVALADVFSAVYPLESPGGWQLIGRTPLRMFDPDRADPVLLAPGDQIRFFAIPRQEFERLNGQVP